MRQFGGTQHVPWLSDHSDIACQYGLKDIDIAVIERTSVFWKERKSTIDHPTYLGNDYEWSTIEFREWRSTTDPCFIAEGLDPLSHRY